jgi:RNA polymerase sigma-70 factor (ECF subfamily)
MGRRRGRREPVSDLLHEWVPRVYRFALRLSHDPHAADDLTQETFLRAWRRRGELRDARSAGVWLFRITANLWRDRLRRGRSPVARAESLEGDAQPGRAPPPERLAAGREELARALGALADLPPRQREVLYLSACEGLTLAEVAAVLCISADAAKASLSLARKRMRELLPDLFPDPAPAEGRPP